MAEKIVQVRPEIRESAQAMERRCREAERKGGMIQTGKVKHANFLTVDDMFAGMERNLARVKAIANERGGTDGVLSDANWVLLDDSAADAMNYLRMACEKIRAAEA